MALHGHARLELINNKSGWIEKVVEHDNNITPYLDRLTNEGNFEYLIDSSSILPIDDKFFGGCILTNKNNENAMSTCMIDGDAEVIAQASNDSYTEEENSRRGSFIPSDSGAITSPATGEKTGFRKVWEWGSSQGNGLIGCVSLCPPEIARTHFSKTIIPTAGEERLSGCATSRLFTLYDSDADFVRLCACNIVDYEKGLGYAVSYDSGIITVKEYILSTKNTHLLTKRLALTGSSANEGECKSVHTYSETISGFSLERATVCYTGDKIHLVTWTSGNNVTVTDRIINVETWSADLEDTLTHQYNGVTLFASTYQYAVEIPRDIIRIIGTDMYALAKIGGVNKIFKFAFLSNNPANTEEIALPTAFSSLTDEQMTYLNGPTMYLSNGDWYKFARYSFLLSNNQTPALYCHNGQFYATRTHYETARYHSGIGYNANAYGTYLALSKSQVTTTVEGRLSLGTIFPHISTVNNIEIVEKKPSFSMRLIYEITETND